MMSPLRHSLLVVTVLLSSLAPVGTAAAGVPDVSLTPGVAPPTSLVDVNGYGFAEHETVLISFDEDRRGKAMADDEGRFEATIQVPGHSIPGEHLVSVLGRDSGRYAEAVFLVRTNWSTERFDFTRAGANPYENILNVGNVNRLSLAWTQRIGDRSHLASVIPAPAVADGLVFAGGADGLGAYDAATGAQVWRREAVHVDSSPSVVDGVVYIAGQNPLRTDHTYRYVVAAFDAGTGAHVWTFTLGWFSRSSPAVVDGVVYVGATDGFLYALDAADGHQLWAREVTERFNIVSTPAVVEGRVYLHADGPLEAFDAATGITVWESTCGDGGASYEAPSVVDGVVYVRDEGLVCAFDAVDGEALWTAETEPNAGVVELGVGAGLVYVVTNDTVLALDASTGTEVWRREPGVIFYGHPPALANGVLYVTERTEARAFDAATGDTVWETSFEAERDSSTPAVADGQLYFTTEDEALWVFALP
jgi:outer membrane protein assembly factor BamB